MKEIKEFLTKTKLTTEDVHTLQMYLNTNTDFKSTVCPTCPTQIRFAFASLKRWYERQIILQEETEETNIVKDIDIPTESTVLTHQCTKCGDMFIPKDKRNKVCNTCKIK